MKNKGVITAICVILTLGIFTTAGVRRFIEEQQKHTASGGIFFESPEERAGFAMEGSAPVISETEGAGLRGSAGNPQPGAGLTPGSAATESGVRSRYAAVQEQEAAKDALAERETDDSLSQTDSAEGKTGAAAEPDGEAALAGEAGVMRSAAVQEQEAADGEPVFSPAAETEKTVLTLEDYRKRLDEVGSAVDSMRASEVSATTDSMKRVADYEYRLWDSELNRIYQALLECMDESDIEAMKTEERAWIRSRDATARQAAERYAGGTMEGLEYTASLAATTKARAYELLELYGRHLPQEKDESAVK